MADEIKTTETKPQETKPQETKPQETKKTEWVLGEYKLIIEILVLIISIGTAISALSNSANFEIVVEPNNGISIDKGDINTATIYVRNTGNSFLSDWLFKYDSTVGLKITEQPSNVFIALLPDTEQKPSYSEKMVVGVGLNAIATNYNVMITGIGKTQQLKPYTLTIMPENESLDKASVSNKWCKKGRAIMSLNTNKKYYEALDWFDSAISLNSQNDIAFYYKGLVYEKLKLNHNASDCFNQSLNINKGNTDVWAAKARVQEKRGYPKDALDCIDNSLKLGLDNAQLWENKSEILSNLGEYQYAQQCHNLSNILNQRENTNKDDSMATQVSGILDQTTDYITNSYNSISDYFRK